MSMTDPLARDRLYPSLLDRLTDDDPLHESEPRVARALTLQRLRENVLRDLGWLFNATQMSSDEDPADPILSSVLNFGIPALAGRPASQYKLVELAQVLRDIVLRYEPRLIPGTVRVRPERLGPDSHNVIGFRIEGQLWSQPVPLEIYMRTEIDLESGLTRVYETKTS